MNLRLLTLAAAVLLPSLAMAQARQPLPRGLFAVTDQQCDAAREGRENGARFIARDGKTIESYASTCRVKSAKAAGSTHTLDLTCDAEGVTESRRTIVTVKDRNTLDWREDDANWTFKRCED